MRLLKRFLVWGALGLVVALVLGAGGGYLGLRR